ncbi:MAG: NINE protein [Shimia sp.]
MTSGGRQKSPKRDAPAGKVVATAYGLLVSFGPFGAHRFYLGRFGSALGQVILLVTVYLLAYVTIGFALWAVLGVWPLVDAMRLPRPVAAGR